MPERLPRCGDPDYRRCPDCNAPRAQLHERTCPQLRRTLAADEPRQEGQ